MKRFHFAPLTLALALAVGVSACDSGDDNSDKDIFVGVHSVAKIEDNVTSTSSRDLTSAVICATANAGPTQTNPCAVNNITFTFRENGTYSLTVDYTSTANAGGRADVVFDNSKTTFALNESAKTIALQVAASASATAIPVSASYTIDSNNQISLSLPAAVFNTIFASTTYQGLVRVTLT